MYLTIKNTIEDYRAFLEYACNSVIEKHKIIFNILKIALYIAPWGSWLVQWNIIANREYFYIMTFIFLSVIFDLLFYYILKNDYPIRWLVGILLIKIKSRKSTIGDKILESNKDYVKIYNDCEETIFYKKDKIEIIRLDKCLLISSKGVDNRKRYVLISNRSFKNDSEIDQLIHSVE